jgi:hypothetical protein
VQGSHGRHYLDWTYDREASKPGKPKFEGSPVATFFAPTNAAFGLLPPRLKFFLFSKFGERALRKVLAYHYVPHSIVFSEFQYHEKHEHKGESIEVEQGGVFSDAVEEAHENGWGVDIANDPSFHKELEVHSGLPNATLKVVIDKTKLVPIEGESIAWHALRHLAYDYTCHRSSVHRLMYRCRQDHHPCQRCPSPDYRRSGSQRRIPRLAQAPRPAAPPP